MPSAATTATNKPQRAPAAAADRRVEQEELLLLGWRHVIFSVCDVPVDSGNENIIHTPLRPVRLTIL